MKYKNGLVLGKFMPLHNGHMALIQFAKLHCEKLHVLLCYQKDEVISGSLRWQWLVNTFKDYPDIVLHKTDIALPNTSVSDRDVSKQWSVFLKKRFRKVDLFVASELYAQFVGEYMGIDYQFFDNDRLSVPISATAIRENPFKHWDYIPPSVKPYFVKKIALFGAESTGKSTLTEQLAKYFNTTYVPEMARELISNTRDCTYKDMKVIAEAHAKKINDTVEKAHKVLFCDTDLLVTKAYSLFLFNKIPAFKSWVEKANNIDYYLFLQNDLPHEQDGTRLGEQGRDEMFPFFENTLKNSGKPYAIITGKSDERLKQAINAIKKFYFI